MMYFCDKIIKYKGFKKQVLKTGYTYTNPVSNDSISFDALLYSFSKSVLTFFINGTSVRN